jgi:hypothetical protein
MNWKTLIIVIILALTCSCRKTTVSNKIDLAGEWQFAIDSLDAGITEKWFGKNLGDFIQLPGSLTTNGKGDDIGRKTPWTGRIVDKSFFKDPKYAKYREPNNFKVPFWLQPVKYYKGAAWFRKEIVVPENWDGKDIILFLERCHWESRVWIDEHEVGMQNSLGTPHVYNLTEFLTPGKHSITVCIDNRTKEIDPGLNSHSISDHTQTNWNGIVGQLFLEARAVTNIQNIQLFPDIQNKEVKARVKVKSSDGGKINLSMEVTGPTSPELKTAEFDVQPGENIVAVTIPMGDDVKLWNEFHPEVYQLQSVLTDAAGVTDTLKTTFGMREFNSVNRQILINGNPVFLRGTLECAIFPKTGFPPTDKNEWLRILGVCRAHGLNHLRFHSWCPPKAAFEAADEAGFYFQVEASSWPNMSTTLGDGKPIDKYIYEETERMIEAYGNHPSFCMLSSGNEPGGRNYSAFLTEFVNYWKNKDSRRIYVSAAGWPDLEVNDFMNTPKPRIQGWGEEMRSIINAEPPKNNYDWNDRILIFNKPVVSHEIGQWCVYPNFKEIAKYDGVVRAKNFEIFQETLNENGMAHLADSFLLASGKLQALCYKADIEAAMRTTGFGGFQLLGLQDFPGQGTALVGVLDPFWEEKGYISPAEYSRFCNSTVPLARMRKFIYKNNETLEAEIEVAHYGNEPFTASTPKWKITDVSGKVVQEGQLTATDIPLGNAFKLGNVAVPLGFAERAQKLVFEVSVENFTNHWEIWVYPAKTETIAGVEKIKVVQQMDAATQKFLEDGGTVLLTLKKGTLPVEMGGDIKTGFSSIFWNTAWTKGQGPHTLGVLVNPVHPALAEFPTEYHSNWQWWDAMHHGQAMNLAKIDASIKPVVRVIDDWVTNRPLALVFEAKAGNGKIMISSIDFTTDLQKRPEAQQLLFSLKKYMAGEKFNPTAQISAEKLMLLTKQN